MFVYMALVTVALCWAMGQACAQSLQSHDTQSVTQRAANRVTPADRQAAAARVAAQRAAVAAQNNQVGTLAAPTAGTMAAAMAMPMPGGTPDYFGPYPNWALSPLPTVDPVTLAVSGGIRKFVDSLPGLGAAGANDLGQYIPVAVPDITTYPGSDYYEIELGEYVERLHADLPLTRLRGYRQTNTADPTVSVFSYLGPLIIAQKGRPTRIKFTNNLPTGAAGDLFIPADTTVMGAGMGPDGSSYTQNRGTLHLHGGLTPWISDGTPHQWTVPAGETGTTLATGVSTQDVPDMPLPSGGSMTFYYPNQQSARLMFYHDHAYGITRLNVYAGEAAGYLLQDSAEAGLVSSGAIPADQIPLVIQDKTFVDATTIAAQDPTWNWGTGTPDPVTGIRPPNTGDLWFPHVYMPNQNPYDISGANAMGRWDYGPWFWPVFNMLNFGPVPNPYYDPVAAPWEPPQIPGTPNPSIAPEAFLDTPVVNGTAYPYVNVDPKAYRFRILNACNDRFLNLQVYTADPTVITPDGRMDTEVRMVEAFPRTGLPPTWPTDARDGGVPDPATAGPAMIQIGTEGGFLPAPVVIPSQPIVYNYNRRDIVVLNVADHALFLGPADRADVIIDFSAFAGKTLILYNDAPAPVPAFDPRIDYYTGDPDQTSTGGAPPTLPGYGPNTRTIMQVRVSAGTPVPFNPALLNAALPAAFNTSQDPIIVPQTPYGAATDTFSRIQDTSLTFTPTGTATAITIQMGSKAIQELFELDYGRMNATLGVELPFTNALIQTTIPLGYIDPPTEAIQDSGVPLAPVAGDGTQIWKITHNGVDTHAIHFHLFNVQIVNRVGWDGAIRPPDPNELGWKETVRMNPLEDAIVALRPVAPQLPFGVPDSIRPLDVTRPLGTTGQFTNIDPLTNNPVIVTNVMTNFGWEYVWHCHLLGHEENDMMRPIVFNVPRLLPGAPVVSYTRIGGTVNLSWTDGTPVNDPGTLGNPANEIGFRIQRATVGANGKPGAYSQIGSALANQTSYADATAAPGTMYSYIVVAYNAAGDAASNPVTVAPAATPPAAPTNLTATLQNGPQVVLTWSDNATNETGFAIERAVGAGAFSLLATVGPRNNTGNVTYTDATVTAGNTYTYRVKAVNGGGSSAYSNTASVSVPAVPAAPSGLTATAVRRNGGNDRVNLSWTDNSNNETGFTIQRSTNITFTANLVPSTVGANTTTFQTGNVPRNTTYWFRVQATNGAGPSGWSNVVSVTTP